MEVDEIIKFKEAYNDIFGKGVKEYWKYEGCNKRMQKYQKISKFLKYLNQFLKFSMLLFYLIIATITILKLSNGVYKIVNEGEGTILCFIRDYMSFVAVSSCVCFVLDRLGISSLDIKDFIKKMIISLPLIYLVKLNINLFNGTTVVLLVTSTYLMYLMFSYFITSNIDELSNIATGKIIYDDKTELKQIEEDIESSKEEQDIIDKLQKTNELIVVNEVNKKNKNKKRRRR